MSPGRMEGLESGSLDPGLPLPLAWALFLVQGVPLLLNSRFDLTVGLGPQDVGRGYLAVLTIFTILEFFIAVIATHFGCQATRAQTNAVSTLTPCPGPLRNACSVGRDCTSSPLPLPLWGSAVTSFRLDTRAPDCEMRLFTPWPHEGATTSGRTEILQNWRTGLGRVRVAPCTDGPQSVNRGHSRKDSMTRWKLNSFLPRKRKRRRDGGRLKRRWEEGH